MKSPAFQFYVNDWLGSPKIMLMNPAEEGAYIRLLAIAWASEDCGLPNDDNELAVLSRLGEGWFNGASIKIRKCFIEKGSRLYNKRLLQERKKQEQWREKSRQGGILSGKRRKNKELEDEGLFNQTSNDGEGVVEPPLNSSSSFSSSSSDKTFKPYCEKNPEIKECIDFYYETFKEQFGKPPIIQGAKDGKLLKSLLKAIPIEEMKSLIKKFFDSDDPFIQKSGYTIGVFKSQINKLRIGKRRHAGLKSWADEIVEEENARKG